MHTLNRMNANPVKPPISLHDTVDELVANFGAKKILFEILARRLRKIHPPDKKGRDLLTLDHLSDHVRKDIGLQPKSGGTQFFDPLMLKRF